MFEGLKNALEVAKIADELKDMDANQNGQPDLQEAAQMIFLLKDDVVEAKEKIDVVNNRLQGIAKLVGQDIDVIRQRFGLSENKA